MVRTDLIHKNSWRHHECHIRSWLTKKKTSLNKHPSQGWRCWGWNLMWQNVERPIKDTRSMTSQYKTCTNVIVPWRGYLKVGQNVLIYTQSAKMTIISRQPANQPGNQPANQQTSQPTSQSAYQPNSQPAYQPANQPTSQPTNKPTSYQTNQSTNQLSRQPSN